MHFRPQLLALAVSACFLMGCEPAPTSNTASSTTVVEAVSENDKANAFFEKAYMDQVMLSPTSLTQLGIKQNYDQWDSLTDAQFEKEQALFTEQRAALSQLDASKLSGQTALSYQLFRQQLDDKIADAKWHLYNYPINQMYGWHSEVPSLLINQHLIESEADAKAYIARLNGIPLLFTQLISQLDKREQLGIMPPKFVYPRVLSACRNLLQGMPFNQGEDSTLLADFKQKIAKTSLDESVQEMLVKEAQIALSSSVKPAYEQLIAYLEQQQQRAGTDDGVWRFKDGEQFYQRALQRTTTTEFTADEIHQLGLDEVARIHQEMRVIMQKVGFKGDLPAFFDFMRSDPQFYYPDTAEGKAAYLNTATQMIVDMKARLPELFHVQPKADLIVKAVEPFREQSAGKAFYESPSMDGKRPGTYYANLSNMKNMPNYMMEALAYHEGIPGHHMQIAIAQELEQMPKFRKFGGYTAYVEGWGLYTELLPKEMGLYQNPYSDFGRLAMELWRACRLVVDTGIHAKKWTRQQAIDYLVANTPNAATEAENAIERYIVMPSQATAYKVGMIRILQLRTKAQQTLGAQFDIRDFHDVVLKNGAVPLDVLAQLVDEYIANTKSKP